MQLFLRTHVFHSAECPAVHVFPFQLVVELQFELEEFLLDYLVLLKREASGDIEALWS